MNSRGSGSPSSVVEGVRWTEDGKDGSVAAEDDEEAVDETDESNEGAALAGEMPDEVASKAPEHSRECQTLLQSIPVSHS